MSSNKLQGKVAVITGGNSGIGLATAKLFAAEGAQVVFTGRRREAVEAAEKEIGSGAIGITSDAGSIKDHEALVAEVERRFGHIDIYVANAAAYEIKPFLAVDEESFDTLYNTNVKGVYFGVQKALRIFNDGGSIVLVGSIVGDMGMEGASVYGSTKAALRYFAKTWAKELKARKIRVNVLSPGPTETPIHGKGGMSEEQLAGMMNALTGMIPLGRLGAPEDCARAALFLAGPDGSFINGVNLFVDGGLYATA